MKKEEVIKRYGEAEYKRRLAHGRAHYKAHSEEKKAAAKKYHEEHPEEAKAHNQEQHRKGGKHYARHLEYQTTGIPGDKNTIRKKHRHQYKPYKAIIAPESQLHHEWIPETAEYRGLALVEAKPHQYGIIDVIEILDGEITLLTEEEVRKRGRKNDEN